MPLRASDAGYSRRACVASKVQRLRLDSSMLATQRTDNTCDVLFAALERSRSHVAESGRIGSQPNKRICSLAIVVT